MSELFAREAAVIMPTYGRVPVAFVRGEGSWLFDEGGKAYLDCLSGLAVVSVGHANTRVAAAVAEQMTELVHVSNLYYTEPQVRLAERLTQLSGLARVFFANDGATANEAAIKLARRWGQKTKGADSYEVLSLVDSFHGRTLATLAATGQPGKQKVFEPLPPGFGQAKGHDPDVIAAAIGPSTAAVMIETTQGEGGVVPFEAAYLQEIRALCNEADVLMIVDDVQAGMGRTGSWFSWQGLGFEPDIATVAKALANGLPIGACLANERASVFDAGDHATTFGGGPVVCRAALAVIEEIEESEVLANCLARSEQLLEGLSALDGVASVRGRGLLLGAVLGQDRAAEVTSACLDAGLVVNNVRPNVVRFAPPLTITADEVDQAISRFAAALAG
jgi:predicted acetylornithine/succinylornithine family transaminase